MRIRDWSSDVCSSDLLKCLGATTYNEYRGIFEKDHALSRRFQKIDVAEPTVEQTIQILRGLKGHFEAHHGERYTAAAITDAAELSARHINDCFLPDKAFDFIDEAGPAKRLLPRSRQTHNIGKRSEWRRAGKTAGSKCNSRVAAETA